MDVKSMDLKENSSRIPVPSSVIHRIRTFFRGIQGEISQISWTSREQLSLYTKIVVIVTLCAGMTIYFLDLAIRGCLMFLSSLLSYL